MNHGENPISVLMITVRADHGGGPRHLELLLKHLPADVEAHVACPDEPPYRARLEYETGGRVVLIPHRRFTLGAALRLVAYARRNRIDLIHAHGKGAGAYARLATMLLRCRSVHTPHGVHVSQYKPWARRLYRAYENLSARWVDSVVYVSDEEREVARTAGLWPRTRACVIVNGVEDVDDAVRADLRRSGRAQLGIADDRIVAATLSRFDYQKNMQEAYAVVAASPHILFLWAGDGEDAAGLRRRATSEGLDNVCFLGSQERSAPLLAMADIYLSTARWEGLPLAVIEAMAMGLPVVASDVTGHRELVGASGGGLLYPAGQPARAAAQLARLSGDAALRSKMGERGRAVQQERYSARRVGADIHGLYQSLVASQK
ncbi:hypothetical protein BI364_12380 [Acidihalobacter yilgarnensis]|uniref:Glycosyltransferase subfamily 4-like N-terminal domain-containing protein n=1 Tax=Acidihalobacter yilgarnensis TaxID=2819280 RepID=A0A1D8IQ68_9GAMM|nr:glycosyltransferase [Acidihalobacter yilgarnensis]AOU98648.1 hypothetical protein BI364_12380 [Acidihalobacter yilgarnensis]